MFAMRDEFGQVCPRCGGSGRLPNLATMSPSDEEPCPCTFGDDDADADANAGDGPAA
jgi:hypothetical protein